VLIGNWYQLLLSRSPLWIRTPAVPKRSLRAYYRSPVDFNYQENQDFIQANKLEKVPTFLALADSSYGGTTLFSRPNTDAMNLLVKPSLGLSWTLADIGNRAVESDCGMGIFRIHLPSGDNNEKEGNFILSHLGRDYMLNGAIEPNREGITFPIETLKRVVNSLSFVEISHICVKLEPAKMTSKTFALLVFVTPREESLTDTEKAAWTRTIEQKIEDKLGKGFVPEKVEYYPLMPRWRKGEVDPYWCEQQHKSGLLAQKVKNPLFQHLHMMKKVVAEAPRGPVG